MLKFIIHFSLLWILGSSQEMRSLMLVTTGAPLDEFTQKTEIIDLLHPEAVCEKITDFPKQIEGANAGVLLNHREPATSQVVICGGIAKYGPADFRAESICYFLDGEWLKLSEMQSPRKWSSSVVLDQDTLWITGGHDDSAYLSTTELIRLDGPSIPGPDLPEEFGRHCVTKINETHVILIGGHDKDGATLLVDIRDFSMVAGPSMSIHRYQHACGTFQHEGKPMIIAVGGYGQEIPVAQKNSEILDLDLGRWITGPRLPHTCTHATIVPTPDNQGVILLGCYQNHDPIHQLMFTDGRFEWQTWDRQLEIPRDDTVAMIVPDQFVNCN